MIEDSNTYDYLVRYQNPNHQGSCCMETNQTGDVITYEEYHPFGTTSYQAMNANITAAYKRYRYTGMERDEETGLSYHNARYYITWLGRWLNPDPIGIGDGVNVYRYCDNNPIRNVDKKGTQLTSAGSYSGVTPQQEKEKPYSTGNNSQPLAAIGNINPASLIKANKETETIQTQITTTKVFVELGLIDPKSLAAKDDNTGTKLSGLLQAFGGFMEILAGAATAETGVGLILAAHGFDDLQAGLRQALNGKVTQTWTEGQISTGLQAVGYNKEDADKYASYANMAFGMVGGASGLAKSYNTLTKAATNRVINMGPMIEGFGVPKYYTYRTLGGKDIFVTPNAMKHLEELASHGGEFPNYQKLLGQLHQESLHEAIEEVIKKEGDNLVFGKMYYTNDGNEIIFSAPRNIDELPAVKHFR